MKDLKTESKFVAWISEGYSGSELITLVDRYRKRSILAEQTTTPVATIRPLAASTTAAAGTSKPRIGLDETSLMQALATSTDIRFQQSEIAFLTGVSTKTVSRRVSELAEGDYDHAE